MAAAEVSAAANATNLDEIPDFIHEIFYPAPFASFRDSMPTGELDIKTTYPFHMIIHKSAETNQVIETIDYFKKFNQQKAA
jgi:hypothetical protein